MILSVSAFPVSGLNPPTPRPFPSWVKLPPHHLPCQEPPAQTNPPSISRTAPGAPTSPTGTPPLAAKQAPQRGAAPRHCTTGRGRPRGPKSGCPPSLLSLPAPSLGPPGSGSRGEVMPGSACLPPGGAAAPRRAELSRAGPPAAAPPPRGKHTRGAGAPPGKCGSSRSSSRAAPGNCTGGCQGWGQKLQGGEPGTPQHRCHRQRPPVPGAQCARRIWAAPLHHTGGSKHF